MRTRRALVGVGMIALVCVAVLGYGYWRAVSRAYVMIGLADVSAGPQAPVFNAEVMLRDAAGTVLAEGRSDARFGTVSMIHPQLGSCEEEEAAATTSVEGRARWDKCIGAKFLWQAEWAPRVSRLDIRFAQCRVADVPIALRMRRDDWWLWWVPLPHIGGDPYTDFSARVVVNAARCQARAE